jgi:hypothetical protein
VEHVLGSSGRMPAVKMRKTLREGAALGG